ncbi:hypothetical protein AGMMS50276_17250 [Synergistales bacterium]|nr:hypothetical protein AGMMS50276_17250 [Synergistales bacterium]
MKKIISVALLLAGIFVCANFAEAAMSAWEFHDLCLNGTPQKVEAAIKGGADVNARDKDGYTALTYAARSNLNPEVIALLLKNGADINVKSVREGGLTALMVAAGLNPNPEVTELLLKNGADINTKTESDQAERDSVTALMLAAWRNPNPAVVSLLLNNGADAYIKAGDGKRAIDYARENNRLKGTEALRQLEEASKR